LHQDLDRIVNRGEFNLSPFRGLPMLTANVVEEALGKGRIIAVLQIRHE
jgi:hypothetical protein